MVLLLVSFFFFFFFFGRSGYELVFIRFILCYSKYSKENYTLAVHSHGISMFYAFFLLLLVLFFFFSFHFRLICSIHSVGFYCLFLCSRRFGFFFFLFFLTQVCAIKSISLGITCRRCLCCVFVASLFVLHYRPRQFIAHYVCACIRSCVLFLLFFFHYKSFFINFSSLGCYFFFVCFLFGQLFLVHCYMLDVAMAWLWTLDDRRHKSLLFKHIFQALHLFSLFTFNWPIRKKRT